MAHDVTFKQKNKQIYFFGYANGIFYKMFNCQKFDRGLSGSSESIEIDFQICLDTVLKICKSPTALHYPDQNRFPEFKEKFLDSFSKEKGNITIKFC